MPGNNGKLREFKGFVAESPAGFEFGNFLRRHRQMNQDSAMFSPSSEFWRPARDHALGVKKRHCVAPYGNFFPKSRFIFPKSNQDTIPGIRARLTDGRAFFGRENQHGREIPAQPGARLPPRGLKDPKFRRPPCRSRSAKVRPPGATSRGLCLSTCSSGRGPQ